MSIPCSQLCPGSTRNKLVLQKGLQLAAPSDFAHSGGCARRLALGAVGSVTSPSPCQKAEGGGERGPPRPAERSPPNCRL